MKMVAHLAYLLCPKVVAPASGIRADIRQNKGWQRHRHVIARRFFAACAAIALMAVCGPMRAVELSFKTTTATFTAPVEANGYDVVFEFSNASSEVITITDIQTGCGCVTSALEKRSYQPGENGALNIHVDFQDKTGPIKKILRVKFKGAGDSGDTEQKLKIDGVALTPLSLSSLTVSWAGGGVVTTKEILVTLKEGFEIADLAVENPTLSQHFQIESRSQARGGLVIAITPLTNDGGRVSLVDGRELQQAYFLTYKYLPTGQVKRERFYAIIHRP